MADGLADVADELLSEVEARLARGDCLRGLYFIAAEHQAGRITDGQAMLWAIQTAGMAIAATDRARPWLNETSNERRDHHGV